MSTVPSLYNICFDYIKNQTEELVSLEGIPYNPIVENILKYLFISDVPLNKNILDIIPKAHSKALRSANLTWTRIMFQSLTCSVHPRLMTLSRDFPLFVTHLKMGATDLCDNDIYLFSTFTNLVVLDLSENQNISDRTVSYITTLALSQSDQRGLIHLKELYLNNVKGITDKSLKFFGKLNLHKLYLTGTSITKQVATTFLTMKGYKLYTKQKIPYFTERLSRLNFKLHQFIEQCSCEYPIPMNRKMFNHVNDCNTTVEPTILDFWRNDDIPTTMKRKESIQHDVVKRPKLSDFLAKFEHELIDE